MGEQDENLDRVTARIGVAIVAFFRARTEMDQRDFHVEDLRIYVRSQIGMIAPASSDRVMRSLRQEGFINYSVISRANSLYRIEDVPPAGPPSWYFNGEDQGQLF